ncbi:MAG: CBS domain-containing protein [Candidatus Hecatellales archaeon]|nr:MAG: CBS domain-containing protein [Candidatus Hecatellales archaeon]
MASNLMPEIKVKEVMRSPVYTISEKATVDEAAKLLAEHEVGSLVVVNEEGKPVGILTERDLVRRVMVKNLLPSQVKVSEVMSSPLITIPPDISLKEAARQMGQLGIKKLVIVEKDQPIGIISSREVLQTTPTLIDVLHERVKVGMVPPRRSGGSMSGYCESCGQWSDALVEANGSFVCEECASEVTSE